MIRKTELTLPIHYDEQTTDPEALASALDTLLETALSTPGILSEYGPVQVDEFKVGDSESATMAVASSWGQLQPGDGLDERCHTWLQDEEGTHVAFFAIGRDKWLRVFVAPRNYPGFELDVLKQPDFELARQIQEDFAGWQARKCNIAEVKLDAGHYVTDEGEAP